MSYVDDLIAKVSDIERRLRRSEALDVNPPVASTVRYSGTPTANAVAYWPGAGTIAGDRGVYINSGGSVGFGTSSPGQFLHAYSNLNASYRLRLEHGGTASAGQVLMDLLNDAGHTIQFVVTGTGFTPSGLATADTGLLQTNSLVAMVLRTINSADIIFGTNNTERMRLLAGGGLAVGLSSMGATTLGVKAGTSSNDAAVGGVLYNNSTAVGNVGTGEDDLMTYTVPANTLSANNMSLEFEAWITFAANANTKTVKVYFGSDTTTIWGIPASMSNNKIHVQGEIVRTGAATQKAFIHTSTTAEQYVNFGSYTRTLSGTVALKFTGEATSNNDIVMEYFKVKWCDNNV